MSKIIFKGPPGPDDPMWSEPPQSYSPHWARALLRSKKTSPDPSDGHPTEQVGSGKTPSSRGTPKT